MAEGDKLKAAEMLVNSYNNKANNTHWTDLFVHGFTDTQRGVKQLLGVGGQTELDVMRQKDNQMWAEIDKDPWLLAPFLLGTMVDPVNLGFFIPGLGQIGMSKKAARIAQLTGKRRSFKSAVSTGVGVGAAQGFLGYESEGTTRGANALIGGTLGGGIAAGVGLYYKRKAKKMAGNLQNYLDSRLPLEELKSKNLSDKETLGRLFTDQEANQRGLKTIRALQQKTKDVIFQHPGLSILGAGGGISAYIYAKSEGKDWENNFKAAALGTIFGVATGMAGKAMLPKNRDITNDPFSKHHFMSREQIFESNQPYLRIFSDALAERKLGEHKLQGIVKELEKLPHEQRKALYKWYTEPAKEIDPLIADMSKSTKNTVKEGKDFIMHLGDELYEMGYLNKKVWEENRSKYLGRFYLKDYIKNPRKLREVGHTDITSGRIYAGELIKRKNLSAAKREALGEISDLAFAMNETGKNLLQDITSFRLFSRVNEAFGMAPKNWHEAVKSGRIGLNDYVKLPTSDIARVRGKSRDSDKVIKEWGDLSGQYVPKDIAGDLYMHRKTMNSIYDGPGVKRLVKAQNVMKKALTVYNPVTHMNNVVSNAFLFSLADGKFSYLAPANRIFKAIQKRDFNKLSASDKEIAESAIQRGIFDADFITNEFNTDMQNIYTKVLKDYLKDKDDVAIGQNLGSRMVEKATNEYKRLSRFSRTKGFAKAIDRKVSNLYRAEDSVFRLGYYIQKRHEGFDSFQAAEMAKRAILNYNIEAARIKDLKNFIYPFISFPYRAIPRIVEGTLKRPVKVGTFLSLLSLYNHVGVMGGEDIFNSEKATRRHKYVNRLRDKAGGQYAERITGLPFAPPVNLVQGIDKKGQAKFLNTLRWIPGADVTKEAFGEGVFPGAPEILQPNSLAFNAMNLLLRRNDITGNRQVITHPTDISDNILKMLPQMSGVNRLSKSLKDVPRIRGGTAQSTQDVVRQLLGFKTTTLGRRDASAYRGARVKRFKREMAEKKGALRRQYRNKEISRVQFRARLRSALRTYRNKIRNVDKRKKVKSS